MSQIPPYVIKQIPAIKKATHVLQRFSDSTHSLWKLELEQNNTISEKAFLKVCVNTGSSFWQIMQQLFGLDLRKEITDFHSLYQTIGDFTSLKVPELIQAESVCRAGEEEGAYILTTELAGSAVEDASSHMLRQLAEYLAEMHQHKSKNWGLISEAVFTHAQWPIKLRQVLIEFSKRQNIPSYILSYALESCDKIKCDSFVPMMPDLRWDQFLQQNQKLTALVDLDAFVFGPTELDFVLLETFLSVSQFSVLLKTYSQTSTAPDITDARPAYRLLLFLMQVQGEQDIEAWMNAKPLF